MEPIGIGIYLREGQVYISQEVAVLVGVSLVFCGLLVGMALVHLMWGGD